MKDVQATLRRLDEEIVGHKQAIARHQVEIARLQDTRTVLMNLAESDIEAAQAHREERGAHITNGQHAKPVLIVRKTGSGDEGPPPTMHAKNGGETKTSKPRRKLAGSVSGQFRERILKALEGADEPMASLEIGDYLGVPRGDEPRKPMSNALYQLRVKGEIVRDAQNRYSLPQRPQ